MRYLKVVHYRFSAQKRTGSHISYPEVLHLTEEIHPSLVPRGPEVLWGWRLTRTVGKVRDGSRPLPAGQNGGSMGFLHLHDRQLLTLCLSSRTYAVSHSRDIVHEWPVMLALELATCLSAHSAHITAGWIWLLTKSHSAHSSGPTRITPSRMQIQCGLSRH